MAGTLYPGQGYFGQDRAPDAGGAKVDYALTADAGSYILTGQAATGLVGRKLAGAVGSYALTGQAATFGVARKLSGAVGSYALSGQSATLAYGRTLSGVAGSYAYTGQAVTGLVGRNLTGASGAYALAGIAADFTVPTVALSGGGAGSSAGGKGYDLEAAKARARRSKKQTQELRSLYRRLVGLPEIRDKVDKAVSEAPRLPEVVSQKSQISSVPEIDWSIADDLIEMRLLLLNIQHQRMIEDDEEDAIIALIL